MTAPKWTEAHRREGRSLALAILSRLVLARGGDALDKLDETVEDAGFENAWRPRSTLSYALRLDAAGMRRALRRVRALAEGRLVRETTWHARLNHGGLTVPISEESARGVWRHSVTATGAVVRVTRIRRQAGGVGR